jgi:hypothetical protein
MPLARATRPTSPSSSAVSRDTGPAFSKRERTEGASQSRFHRIRHVLARLFQTFIQLRLPGRVEIEQDAAGPDQAASETVSANQRRQVQKIAANASAKTRRGQIADVTGQRAEVAGMIGEPFQFQRDGAQRLRPRRYAAAGQGFDRLAMCQRVADGRVPGKVSM